MNQLNCVFFFQTQNTSHHLDLALDVWNQSVIEHQLTQTANFLALLAINQSKPSVALSVLPEVDAHHSSTNIRLVALIESNKIEDVFDILTIVLTQQISCKISSKVVSILVFIKIHSKLTGSLKKTIVD